MMFLSFIFSCYCFNPVCTKSFSGDLWSTVNNFYCDGDALITINSQTISKDRWTNIGSWNRHVTGTLKIQGIGKVIVDGGFKITGWTQDLQNPNILKTTISKTINGLGDAEDHVTKWKFESLWVNDHDATRARIPGNWTLPTIKSVSTSGSGDFLTYTVGVPSSTMKFLSSLSNDELTSVNIVIFHYWSTTRAYISSINTNANTITFQAHQFNSANNKGIEANKAYFYLDNLKTALTKPGQWFLSKDGELFYYPLPGETASNIEAYASHVHRLMYIETNNLIIENIEFRHCGGNIPDTGVTREDHVPQSPALNMKAIDVNLASNVQFINCSFRHLFCRALSIYESKNCVVERCLVEDFGADGIAVGASSGTRIYNNILRHGGRLIHHENCFYDNKDPGAVISHNDISDNFWDGINCWLEDSACDMTIEKNHVHHIGFNLLDDIGCIYVTNAQTGVVIQNNYVHDAGCHNYGAWGLYVDLNCHNVVVQNNVAHDFYDGCVHFHYGFNNVVKNNILGFNKKGLMSKGENNAGTMVTINNNIFVTNEGNFYCDLWAGNTFNSYSNIYWDFNLGIQWFRDGDGKDNTGTLIDPKFKDPLKRDFNFADSSVVTGLGFVPFTYSDCGVVGDEWRKVASSYVIPAFPKQSTDDEALLSSEKVYPDYDRVQTPSASRSRSPTPSRSPSASPSKSPSRSPSASPSRSPSRSPSPSPSKSRSPSPSKSPSRSPSPSPSRSPSPSPSRSPSPSPSRSPSPSPSRSPSPSPSRSPSPSPSRSPSPSPSKSRSPSPSKSRSPSQSPSPSRSFTKSQSFLPQPKTPTPSQSPSKSPSKSPSRSPTPSPSRSRSPTKSLSPTPSSSISPSPTRSISQSQSQTFIKSPTASKSRTPTQSPSPSKSKSQAFTQTYSNFPTESESRTPTIPPVPIQSPTQVPVPTMTSTPTKLPTRSPSPTPLPSLSDLEIIGETSTIYVTKESDIDNSSFINCTLIDDGEYLFVVQNEAHFSNVDFLFLNSKIGAIKIEYQGEVTIENCTFVGCTVKNGNGNAIVVSHKNSEKKSSLVIDDSIFENCGAHGHVLFYLNSGSNLHESLLDLIDTKFVFEHPRCSALYVNDNYVKVTLNNASFINHTTKQNGGALYVASVSSILIENSLFSDNSCGNNGGAIFFDYQKSKSIGSLSSSSTYCTISSCLFERNKASASGNAIYVNDQRHSISYIIVNNTFSNNYNQPSNAGYVIVSQKVDLTLSSNEFNNKGTQVRVNPYMNLLKPPFKTPEPMAVENVKPSSEGVVDTSSLTKNNTLYIAEIKSEKVALVGEGNDNLYLQLTKTVEIEETNATFGILLGSSDQTASVKLNQEESNMNIKGGGTLTIDTGKNVDSLSIGEVIISHHQNLNLAIKQSLSSFDFESLNMYGESSFGTSFKSSNSSAKVNSITVFEGADTKMSNLEVTSNVDIGQGSTIELNDVILSKSEISIEFTGSGQSYSTFSGKLGNPPNSIQFKVSSNKAGTLEDQSFYIASASKDNFSHCKEWKDRVSLSGTEFKSVHCNVENGNQVLFASTSPEEKSKFKITLPIFIAFVAGVVVIIVIIIVTTVVCIRKKRKIASSDVPAETNNNDDYENDDDKYYI